jgi:O-antigen ligase
VSDVLPILPTRGDRVALRVMQLGAIAVVLAASTFTAFELDRFFVPKELVLHLTAVAAGVLTFRRVRFSRVDWLLTGFVLLGVVSTLFATNVWLAMRAVAITASGLVLFWAARVLREAGLGRPLRNALALAVVLVAATSLLQTYGVEPDLFSESRAPGGTLGNRNFVAHAAAFGLPLLLLAALAAHRAGGWLLRSAGVMGVVATLVLTRSRAAWLAFGVVVLVTFLAMLLCAPLRRDARTWRRLFGAIALAAVGVAAALIVPNALRWRDDNPYLESVKRVADYQEGSGRGRLVQYQRSLLMTVRHPLLGVGPGNWAVAYPAHAARNDPSLDESQPGMTFNPWPSSDWVAWTSERGFAAVALVGLAFLGIFLGGVRQLRRAPDVDEGLRAMALLGIVAGAALTGLFDAVLLLPLPAFLVWTALGALWVPERETGTRPLVCAMVIALTALGAFRSASQLAAMAISADGDRASLERAAAIDPGNYRLRLRLARIGKRDERCTHARAARGMYPNAAATRAVSTRCP